MNIQYKSPAKTFLVSFEEQYRTDMSLIVSNFKNIASFVLAGIRLPVGLMDRFKLLIKLYENETILPSDSKEPKYRLEEKMTALGWILAGNFPKTIEKWIDDVDIIENPNKVGTGYVKGNIKKYKHLLHVLGGVFGTMKGYNVVFLNDLNKFRNLKQNQMGDNWIIPNDFQIDSKLIDEYNILVLDDPYNVYIIPA